MKNYFLLFISMCFFCSCTKEVNEYAIMGELPIDGYDGRYVYLCELDDNLVDYVNIDSIKIKGTSFVFEGIVPEEIMGKYIFIGKKGLDRINHPSLMFIPEVGNIKMKLNKEFYPTVSGTHKNDELQEILLLNEKIDPMLQEHNDESIMNLVEGKEMPQISEELTLLRKEQSEKIYHYLKKIKDTPLYDELLLEYISGQEDADKKNELLSYAGQRYRNRIRWYNEIIRNR